ncbi:hypothetical protein K505DRAFT_327781 [Melanomma pulvis-pyrius CBS 109.77]|uniref:Uncharacterized protein n=1 Tax=Melanomma pulvis-pyrius CBS 109.77 TaxID=1314802 RepID=A0A6A6X1A5_9PLEO|nr:hypothetical protein K505DRAFT_327781 [Melanomma pulvis-pyrius CBS 109.77]
MGTAHDSGHMQAAIADVRLRLQKLASILARADRRVVRTCMHNQSPGALISLATVVSAALPLGADTLHIVKALSHSPEFRDSLLVHTPALLCALLTKANASQADFDEHAELGVLLLSHPLPDAVPLPASAQPFFLRVFDRAIHAPDVSTLEPIYRMLNGACRELLRLLPSEARRRFDKALCHILSSNSAGQNSMLLLWCIGVVVLAERPHYVEGIRSFLSSSETTKTPNGSPERPWKTASGRKLFGSASDVNKTINLTYLSVMWASKGDVVPDSEAIEGIRIATRTLAHVDQEMRIAWPNTNPRAKDAFLKLPTKILRKGIDIGVQFEALCFHAMVAGENNLPSHIVEQYEVNLANITSLYTDTESLRESLSVSLPLFAPQLREPAIQELLSKLLDISTRPTSSHLSTFLILVEELAPVIAHCAPLRSKILLALSSNHLQESIQGFLCSQERGIQEVGSPYRDMVTPSLHRNLVSAIISMLLTSALTAEPSEPGLPRSLAIALICKQQKLTQVTTQPSLMTPPIAHPSVSLFEQGCTPSTGRHLEDWRDRLKSELESQSFYQRDSVIRSVARICQELENRCDTVEEPLHLEQSKSRELAAQIEQLQKEVLSLESKAVDRTFYIDGLDAEIASAENEKNSMLSSLKELRTQFDIANKEADEILHAAREDFMARELQYQSTIITHEEDLKALIKEKGQLADEVQRRESENVSLRELHELDINAMSNENARLTDEVQRTEREKRSLSALHETLNAKLGDLELGIEAERLTVSQQADEINRLQAVTSQLNDLQFSHQKLVRSSEAALRDLEARHENEMEVASSKANEEYEHLSDKLQDALHVGKQATDAYEDTRRELQLLKPTINSFEAKVQQLNTVCSRKDEELEELRSLRSRVQALMSVPSDNHLPIRTSIANNPRTPRQHRRRKSAIPTQDLPPKATTGTQGITNTAMEHIANASFTSSDSSRDGSTPKRAKPRPTFKILSMNVSSTQNPVYPSQSLAKKLSPAKRSALGQLSPNRRHTIVGFAIPEKDEEEEHEGKDDFGLGKRRGSLGGMDDMVQASFDMDGFLAASTPFTPGNIACGTGRVPEEEESGTEL